MSANDAVSVSQVEEVTPELVKAWEILMPQLSSGATTPNADWLQAIVDSDDILLVASVDGEIVGSTTLVLYRTPTGLRAHIDDVVVDGSMRGRGVARKMTARAIELAEKHEARSIELTTNPKREAANHLYQSMGFKLRQTNLYRYQPQ